VVFGPEGPIKDDYRRYNITGITGGDDYAAMSQALTRRFSKVQEGDEKLPDILFIDGGKGQVNEAIKVLSTLQISGIDIVGVTKGEGRRAELDTLTIGKRRVELPAHSSALHLIQQIRDEAHRFAIAGHRQKRQKTRNTSPLEGIEGLGYLRIVAIPFVVALHYMDYPFMTAFVFGMAGFTDWVDGYLARKWNQESRFGAFLDPVADKLMVAVALVLVAVVGMIGKIKTGAQMTSLICLLYDKTLLGIPFHEIGLILLALATVLTVWSMVLYLIDAFKPTSDSQ